MRHHWLAWICLCLSCSAGGIEIPITYQTALTPGQQQSFQQLWRDTLQILPHRIQQELPDNMVLVIGDLNPGVANLQQPSCDGQQTGKRNRYGRYLTFQRTLQLDYRLVEKLVEGDRTPLACGHRDWYQLAQATLLHELVHAWDNQVAATDEQKKIRHRCWQKKQHAQVKNLPPLGRECIAVLSSRHQLSEQEAFLRLGYWQPGGLWLKQKNTRGQRFADPYAYYNPQEFLAVNMEYFLLDKDWRCRQPMLYQYLSGFFEHQPFPGFSTRCDQPLMVHYGEWPVVKMLDPARIYRIDYVLAGAGDNLASQFGHSMFRLVICAPARYSSLIEAEVEATPFGPACLKDEAFHLVISFRANVDDVVLSYWKGLMGGYTSRMFILPYLQVKEEYTGDQLRDMVLYPLQLDSFQQNALVSRMLESFWSYGGDYRFISNNCAVESQELLQAALPYHALQETSALTPQAILTHLKQTHIVDAADPGIQHVPSQLPVLEKLFAMVFPANREKEMPVHNVQQYLNETRALERAGWFPDGDHQTVERIAALRRLEQHIKRVQLRRLTLLARYHLHDDLGVEIDALQSPLHMNTLQVDGYGVPYGQEVHLDEEVRQQQHRQLKAEVMEWIQRYQGEEWQEYEAVSRNLDSLDILALRNKSP